MKQSRVREVEMVSTEEPAYLQRLGGNRGIELGPDDFEAMDIALSLVPEARVVVVAIRAARQLNVRYPLASPDEVAQLLGESSMKDVGGHHDITAESIERYFVSGDFPIDHEAELASAVYIALNRCARHSQLRFALQQLEAELTSPVGTREVEV